MKNELIKSYFDQIEAQLHKEDADDNELGKAAAMEAMPEAAAPENMPDSSSNWAINSIPNQAATHNISLLISISIEK